MTLKTLIQGRAAGAVVAVPAVVQSAPEPGCCLDTADCEVLIHQAFETIEAEYIDDALTLLDTDPDLAERLSATEDRINDLAKTPDGPTEADFRAALVAYAAVWREIIARHRAHRERQAELADPMPELPEDTVLAIGISYGDGEPGTWDVVRQGRKQ
jgi:hypothetical protein